MPLPTLYQPYRREQALGCFENPELARELCGGQWVVLPEAVLCFATLGTSPGLSYFERSVDFWWVADRPYDVSPGKSMRALPPEAFGSKDALLIFLFGRSPGEEAYRYLGELESSYCQRWPANDGSDFGAARMRLSPALPSALWSKFGGPTLIHDAHAIAALDHSLASLRTKLSTLERLDVVRNLFEYWHGPLGPQDGCADSELGGQRIPPPLRWYHHHLGRRLLTSEEAWTDPAELAADDEGKIVFLQDTSGRWSCATTWGEDPPVWGRLNEEGSPWKQQAGPLSEFLIQATFFGIGLAPFGSYTASATDVSDNALQQITAVVPPLALAGGFCPTWGADYETRFYAKGGVFMTVSTLANDPGGEAFLFLMAKTEHPLQFLRSISGINWVPELTAF